MQQIIFRVKIQNNFITVVRSIYNFNSDYFVQKKTLNERKFMK